MSSAADLIAQQLATVPNVDVSIIGTFISQSGTLAVVDVGDARISIPTAGVDTVPVVGDPVRLMRVNTDLVMLGTTLMRAPFGRVVVGSTGPAASTVEYPNGSGVTKSMLVPSGLVLSANDTVRIDWAGGGVVAGKYGSVTAPVPPDDPSPPPSTGAGRQVFTAIDSGSWGSSYGWNTNEVWASNSYTGAWFYGNKISSTIPDDAVITAISIYLPIRQNSGAAPNFGVHTSGSKPGGNVTFVTTTPLGTRSGWVPIPTGYGDYLKVNSGGTGFDHGGYNIYRGIQTDGQSGALDISWTV